MSVICALESNGLELLGHGFKLQCGNHASRDTNIQNISCFSLKGVLMSVSCLVREDSLECGMLQQQKHQDNISS